MSTQAVTYTVPSPAWTGSIDVTDANLLTDASIKDFTIFYNNVEQGTVQLALWTKTSYTQLTYSGAALTTNDVVTVRRKTPTTVVQTVTPQSTILSSLWNAEFDRVTRRAEEYDTFWMTTTPNSGSIVNTAFGVGWDGVTGDAPSKNAVYDAFETGAHTTSGAWNMSGSTVTLGTVAGTVTATGTFDLDAATAVLVPTRTSVDIGGEPDTHAASQAWVYQNLPVQTMNGRLTTVTARPVLGYGDNSSDTIYYTPYLDNKIWLYNTTGSRWELFKFSEVSLALGTVTAKLPYDIYVYNNSGTITLEKVAWTNATTRATAVTTQNNVWVKTGSADKRYIGTIIPDSTTTVKHSLGNFNTDYKIGYQGIYNAYNKVMGVFFNYNATTDSIGGLVNAKGGWILCMLGDGYTHLGVNNTPSVFLNASGTPSGVTMIQLDFGVHESLAGVKAYSTPNSAFYSGGGGVGGATSGFPYGNGSYEVRNEVNMSSGTMSGV